MSRKRHAAQAAIAAEGPKLKNQVRSALRAQLAIGQSKRDDARAGVDTYGKIYSYRTYENYLRECRLFAKWCEEEHGARTLEDCKGLREAYIRREVERGMSAHTVKKRAAALGKLYQDHLLRRVDTPARHRGDITRSRDVADRDVGFSRERNADLIRFCEGTGLRRRELRSLRCGQLVARDGRLWIAGVKGKGGKVRDVPVISGEDVVRRMMSGDRDALVFPGGVTSQADVHSFRAEYALRYYQSLARPEADVPRSERYCCRGDMAGIHLDKLAMAEVSRALGHNRIDVIASNYLYGLKRP